MGLRAQESKARAKRKPWRLNTRLSKAGRTVHDWLPIHDWSEARVFRRIAEGGQKPFWIYAAGQPAHVVRVLHPRLRRGTCATAASTARNSTRSNRAIERETGYTMVSGASLAVRTRESTQLALV